MGWKLPFVPRIFLSKPTSPYNHEKRILDRSQCRTFYKTPDEYSTELSRSSKGRKSH
jgi:hypothetical protein